ncbi:aminoacyl-tRNA hydrolase, partial [Candidatus Omnitrophota bacterium]
KEEVKLIVGLGNPGRLYINSRHNIGKSCVMALAKAYKITLKKDRDASSGRGRIKGTAVVLALPMTYMNLSGVSVGTLVRKHRIDLSDLLVVCDDLDLDLGRIKIKGSGSSGGHRGLGSIIDSLQSRDFCRLRLGIARPKAGKGDTSRYVLSPFARGERMRVRRMMGAACDCCSSWISDGITKSMNIFNQRRN